MTTLVNECNEKADRAIASMMTVVAGTIALPVFTAMAMGGGAAAIGKCYGVRLTTNEGWKLVKQFIHGAGTYFLLLNVGSKACSIFIAPTYPSTAAALDPATSAALAWAIGATSKEYFQREYLGKSKLSKEELGEIFREAFKNHKNK